MEQMTFFILHLYEEAPHPWHTGSWKQACPSGHGWGMTPERTLLCIPVTDTWRKRSACPWIHPNLLDTADHRLPEEWETSRLWPRQITALDFTSILFLRICHYCAESCCVTWSGPEYLCTSPWQSQRQTEILRSWVQSQHSPTSAACSSTRLFCASLRVSKHLYQQACERQK